MLIFTSVKFLVRIYSKFGNQVAINNLHYRCVTTVGESLTDVEAAASIDAEINTLWANALGNGASYAGCSVTVFEPGLGLESFATDNPQAGAGAGDMLPGNVSGLISFGTGLGGRKNRGRLYFPFPSEGQNASDGTTTGAYRTAVSDALANLTPTLVLTEGFRSATCKHILWHRSDSTYTDVTTKKIRAGWAQMRRRGAYGRPNALPF